MSPGFNPTEFGASTPQELFDKLAAAQENAAKGIVEVDFSLYEETYWDKFSSVFSAVWEGITHPFLHAGLVLFGVVFTALIEIIRFLLFVRVIR